MASLREAGSHGHDAVDVDISILGEGKESECLVGQAEKTSIVSFWGGCLFG